MIYILHPRDGGPIKIGSSEAPNVRKRAISNIFPYGVNILATIDGGRREEKFLHECFRPIRVSDSPTDEWFYASPPIWRFVLDVIDNGKPTFLPDLGERPSSSEAMDKAVSAFGGPREAMDYFGYSQHTTVADTFSLCSGLSSGIWPKLLLVEALRAGRLPKYIADLHSEHQLQSASWIEAAQ